MLIIAACSGGSASSDRFEAEQVKTSVDGSQKLPLLSLWQSGMPAFGVFVPSDRPMRSSDGQFQTPVYSAEGGAILAANPLLDYVFLNLESGWDLNAVSAIREGLDNAERDSEKALLVRIPPISKDGEHLGTIKTDERTSNCNFDNDYNYLYMTTDMYLTRVKL